MRVMVGVIGDIHEGIQLGSVGQEAAIEAIWDDSEEMRRLAEACELERVELIERVRKLGNIGSDFDFAPEVQ